MAYLFVVEKVAKYMRTAAPGVIVDSGPRALVRQNNQSAIGGSRIVFVWRAFRSQPPERPGQWRDGRRELVNESVVFDVYFWGFDPLNPTSDERHLAQALALYEQTIRAIHGPFAGLYEFSDGEPSNKAIDVRAGYQIRKTLTVRMPMTTAPVQFVRPLKPCPGECKGNDCPDHGP